MTSTSVYLSDELVTQIHICYEHDWTWSLAYYPDDPHHLGNPFYAAVNDGRVTMYGWGALPEQAMQVAMTKAEGNMTNFDQAEWINRFIATAEHMVTSGQYRGTVTNFLQSMHCHDPETKAATLAEWERRQQIKANQP